MTRQTLKQKFRQPLGYFMENMLAQYFFESGSIVFSYKHNSKNYDKNCRIKLNKFEEQLENTDLYREYINQYDTNEFTLTECLVRGNQIEMIRWEQDEAIVSEIKSKFGPSIDEPKIYFTKLQLEKLLDLLCSGIKVTVFIILALDTPKFIEIPFNKFKIPNLEKKRNDKITLRIPIDYRDIGKYTSLPSNLFNYNDLESLLDLLEKLYKRKNYK